MRSLLRSVHVLITLIQYAIDKYNQYMYPFTKWILQPWKYCRARLTCGTGISRINEWKTSDNYLCIK
jgi:hypothetical protein